MAKKYEQKTDLILTAVRSLILIVHLEKKNTAVHMRSVFATTLIAQKMMLTPNIYRMKTAQISNP